MKRNRRPLEYFLVLLPADWAPLCPESTPPLRPAVTSPRSPQPTPAINNLTVAKGNGCYCRKKSDGAVLNFHSWLFSPWISSTYDSNVTVSSLSLRASAAWAPLCSPEVEAWEAGLEKQFQERSHGALLQSALHLHLLLPTLATNSALVYTSQLPTWPAVGSSGGMGPQKGCWSQPCFRSWG